MIRHFPLVVASIVWSTVPSRIHKSQVLRIRHCVDTDPISRQFDPVTRIFIHISRALALHRAHFERPSRHLHE